MRRIARNLSLLVFIALPGGLVAGGIAAKLFPAEWVIGLETGLMSAMDALAFQYVVLTPPILVGGIVHQVLLNKTALGTARRTVIVLSGAIVVVPLLLPQMTPPVLRSWPLLVSVVVGLTIYGLAQKRLDAEA